MIGRACAVIALSWVLGCGGSQKPDAAGGDTSSSSGAEETTGRQGGSGFTSSQAVGGMDADQVKSIVDRTASEVDGCVDDGRKRLPFLGGELALSVTVNATGRAEKVVVAQSTLGDQAVESCIAGAFRKKQWPRPVGGKVGKIDQRFEFDSGDAELLSWSSDDLEQAMAAEEEGGGAFAELKKKLGGCRDEAGGKTLQVTMYLDEDGVVQGAGLASPDGKAEQAASCVDTVVRTTSFPAPRRSFAKVTVMVP
jgi:hypothetical protein